MTVAPDVPAAEPASEPAAEAKAAPEPEPAKEPEKKGLTPAQLYERIARKDAQVQALRNELAQLKQQAKPDAPPLKFDPARETRLQFLERMGLTLEEVANEALGRKVEKKDAEAPTDPKLAALEAKLAELVQEREQRIQRERETAVQAKHRQDCELISQHLADKDFPYVTSLGAEAQVLDLVARHIGSHGSFESEQEAAETVEYYARKVETELAGRFDSVLAKPKFKDVLARKLGTSTQIEATPPRQESKGTTRSAVAAAKSNTTQPATSATFDREAALRLAAEEGAALVRRLSSAG